MSIASSASLLQSLRDYHLLEPDQLAQAEALREHSADPVDLVKELVRRGWLSTYQANQIFQGRAAQLLLGSYVLLERLGAGGMGEVFKARNWKLGRIVALKLIRKERLSNPDAVRRFQREIRAAAALSHPNIVHAYDADQIDGTHILVMEYVEGAVDLSSLVKKQGPLPVARAIDFIRQAALGLQHAFERGLVHRDIKPANLLLTGDGQTIKLLDMGLARQDASITDVDHSGTMTREGVVMGTPDYIAPEQAMESHTVDIRGDLYSLGCTLYFLLTGKVPFPGGSLAKKLLRHQMEEPTPLEKVRPDVPPQVAQVVRRLMAKKPEDRFQSPAELAGMLEGMASRQAVEEGRTVPGEEASAAGSQSGDTLASAWAHMEDSGTPAEPGQLRAQAELKWLWVGIGVWSCITLAGLVLLALYLTYEGKEPTQAKPRDDVSTPEMIRPTQQAEEDEWLRRVSVLPAEEQMAEVTQQLRKRNPGFNGQLKYRIEEGKVVELALNTVQVEDIAPLRALRSLSKLTCAGVGGKRRLSDLTPLKGMPLTYLCCHQIPVSDLTPLQGMPLTHLDCRYTQVSDLTPLRGMKLTLLNCWGTQVADLTPLEGMKLTSLHCHNTQITDLTPLKGMPLTDLWCDFKPGRDTAILRSIPTLKTINGKPAEVFWKEVQDRAVPKP